MRTQNPVIYAGTKKLVDKLYPNEEGNIPERIKKIGKHIAKDYLKMKDFDENSFVSRENYGCSLYDKTPRHEISNKFCDEDLKLDYAKGDCVILIGEVKCKL